MPLPLGQGRAQRDPREEMLRALLMGMQQRQMPQASVGGGTPRRRPRGLPGLGGGPELMNALRSMSGADMGRRPR